MNVWRSDDVQWAEQFTYDDFVAIWAAKEEHTGLWRLDEEICAVDLAIHALNSVLHVPGLLFSSPYVFFSSMAPPGLVIIQMY